LVEDPVAVAAGDLEQRTGIQSKMKLQLASSFDVMTEKLSETQTPVAGAGQQAEASSRIDDGVIVLDTEGQSSPIHPALQRVLATDCRAIFQCPHCASWSHDP